MSRFVLCYKKDWSILLHLIYFYYLLLVTNYLITKLSVTDNFSACREYLTENRLSFPSAPRWVRHSYLSKEATIDPLYFWVINTYHLLIMAPILLSQASNPPCPRKPLFGYVTALLSPSYSVVSCR